MSKSSGNDNDKTPIVPPKIVKAPPPLPTMADRRKAPKSARSKGKIADDKSGPSGAAKWWATAGGVAVAMLLIAWLSWPKPQKPSETAAVAQTDPGNQTPGSDVPSVETKLPEDVPAAVETGEPSVSVGDTKSDLLEASNELESTRSETELMETPVAESDSDVMPAPATEDVASAPVATSDDGSQSKASLDTLIASAASLVKSKKGKEAVALLKKASNLYPKDIRPDFYLGLLYSAIGVGDPKTAETYFKRVLDRSPNHFATLNNLALVEIRARRFAPARSFLSIALKNNPDAFEVNQNLGRLINQARTLDIKNDELKRINSVSYRQTAFNPKKGWMYLPLDESDRAVGEYKSFCRNGNLEDRSCNICGGKSFLRCTNCTGDGTDFAPATAVDIVSTPLVTRSFTTATSTMTRCRVCGGDGRIDCGACTDGTDPSLR